MTEQILVYTPSKTTHWKNLFPKKSELLGSHNLNEGEELVVRIVSVGPETIKDKNGNDVGLPVMTFDNAPPMVLNITNSKTISSLYGELIDGWIGKSIQLFSAKIKHKGELISALRIRPQIPTTNLNTDKEEAQLRACDNMDALKTVFMGFPVHIQKALEHVKNEMKDSYNV